MCFFLRLFCCFWCVLSLHRQFLVFTSLESTLTSPRMCLPRQHVAGCSHLWPRAMFAPSTLVKLRCSRSVPSTYRHALTISTLARLHLRHIWSAAMSRCTSNRLGHVRICTRAHLAKTSDLSSCHEVDNEFVLLVVHLSHVSPLARRIV